jgi:2,3-bisphosphoglycerate-independent phosphoglycerate mutase
MPSYNPEESCILIRGSFATLGGNGNLIDMEAGRDGTGLDELAKKLDGMEICGIRFTVKRSEGPGLVIIMRGRNLSDMIAPNDPERANVPLPQVKPKEASGKFTASVLNRFIYRASRVLGSEPVNRKRELPANAVIIKGVELAEK